MNLDPKALLLTISELPAETKEFRIRLDQDEILCLAHVIVRERMPDLQLANDPRGMLQRMFNSVWDTTRQKILKKAVFPGQTITLKLNVAESTALMTICTGCLAECQGWTLRVISNLQQELLKYLLNCK